MRFWGYVPQANEAYSGFPAERDFQQETLEEAPGGNTGLFTPTGFKQPIRASCWTLCIVKEYNPEPGILNLEPNVLGLFIIFFGVFPFQLFFPHLWGVSRSFGISIAIKCEGQFRVSQKLITS